MTPVPTELADLARALGVAVDYYDQGGQFREVSADSVLDVLAALGVDASTAEARATAWQDLRLRDWRRALPPAFVTRQGVSGRVWAHVRHGWPVTLEVELEDGFRAVLRQLPHDVAPVEVDGVLVGEAAFEVPDHVPAGYHRIEALDSDGSVFGVCSLIVAPQRLELPAALAEHPVWGLMAQLYSVRSSRSWGVGDLADLAELGSWAALDEGAAFLLVNPLHASSPLTPMAPSPYLPVARRFFAPWYLRVEDIPEFDDLSLADEEVVEALAAPLRTLDADPALLDRDAVWEAKRAALELIRRVPLTAEREAEFAAYRADEGPGLTDFAVWCALVEENGFGDGEWPEELRHPGGDAVAEAAVRLADRVEFHTWLQWLVDQQLAESQRALQEAGMPIGVIHDLAVGVHPEGADAWALQDVLAQGIEVGCPPDMYNQMGQNWSQPPWHPWALAEAGFVPFRDMLRTILRHAGGIRVDHMLGLFRLWWIPAGRPPYEGTYVTYDHEALLGILCLEAQRAGALVIGEDLGTVEPWVQEFLASRGVLGTSILWFERRPDGSIIEPEEWRPACLSSVSVHDLPPTAGYIEGVHVDLRERLGLLSRPVEEERAAHDAEIAEWRELLVGRGLLEPGGTDGPDDVDAMVVALHRCLAQSPSLLQGVALVDLVGDVVPQNQPGTDQEHPNWRIPLCDRSGRPVLVDDLRDDPLLRARVARIVDAVRR